MVRASSYIQVTIEGICTQVLFKIKPINRKKFHSPKRFNKPIYVPGRKKRKILSHSHEIFKAQEALENIKLIKNFDSRIYQGEDMENWLRVHIIRLLETRVI